MLVKSNTDSLSKMLKLLKDVTISVKIDPIQNTKMRQASKYLGMKLSVFVREAIDEKLAKVYGHEAIENTQKRKKFDLAA